MNSNGLSRWYDRLTPPERVTVTFEATTTRPDRRPSGPAGIRCSAFRRDSQVSAGGVVVMSVTRNCGRPTTPPSLTSCSTTRPDRSPSGPAGICCSAFRAASAKDLNDVPVKARIRVSDSIAASFPDDPVQTPPGSRCCHCTDWCQARGSRWCLRASSTASASASLPPGRGHEYDPGRWLPGIQSKPQRGMSSLSARTRVNAITRPEI
jgi:hypothetical protein